MGRPSCWAAANLPGCGPCDGRLVKAHLVAKQRIRRELISQRSGLGRSWPTNTAERAELDRILWDERCWVWLCGGPTGIGGHHGALDYARTLRVPRHVLPRELEEFAAEFGLVWSLDRDYGGG